MRETTCFELKMLKIFLYLWSVYETKEIVWLIDWSIVCLKEKNWNFPHLPSQNGLTNFCQILHDNSTPQRNDISWTASQYVKSFSIYRGVKFAIFHILREWLLTQRSALPCIRVILSDCINYIQYRYVWVMTYLSLTLHL